jgi:threonine dehydrogenase-like Zn-dependent dehydrogenase
MYGADDVRVANVPDPVLREPTDVPLGFGTIMRNIGVAPARAYIDELLPDVLDGTIQPGRVFDRAIRLDEVPDGYRAMASREALKVIINP